jgi:hypothetical protein
VNNNIKRQHPVDRPALLPGLRFPSIRIPTEDGWRKVARCFLRTEHSKFTLAVFRLDPWSDVARKPGRSQEETRTHIMERLAAFLGDHSLVQGRLRWGKFSTQYEWNDVVDIVYAAFDHNGKLAEIRPCFDGRYAEPAGMSRQHTSELNAAIINVYNQVHGFADGQRPERFEAALLSWLHGGSGIPPGAWKTAEVYIGRVLAGTFLQFEMLPQHVAPHDVERFQCPDWVQRKHPGLGILNICCRVTADLREADLWFQVSHIPIDGVPMQEILDDLKFQWKTAGPLVFPAIHDAAERTCPRMPVRCSTDNGVSVPRPAERPHHPHQSARLGLGAP